MQQRKKYGVLEDPSLSTPVVKKATLVSLGLMLVGITAAAFAAMRGQQFAYGVSREVPWGIVVAGFAFLAPMATGLCLVAVLGRAFGVAALAPLGGRAIYLSMVSFVAAVMLACATVDSPVNMLIFNATSPNLTSNVWWMSTLYGIMTGCMLFAFAFLVGGSAQAARNMGIVGAVAGIGANNNLGALLTVAADPPIWYGVQLLVLLLASAVLSGCALIVVASIAAYRLRQRRMDKDTTAAVHAAATIMALMLAVLLVVNVARFTTIFTGEPDPGAVAALALLKGPLAFNFWFLEIGLGLLLPLVLLGITRLRNTDFMGLAAVSALFGCFVQRYDVIVAGRIVPRFADWLPAPGYLHYRPSVVELLVVLGSFGLLVAGFLVGERFFGKAFFFRKESP